MRRSDGKPMSEFGSMTCHELLELLDAGKCSSVEVVEDLLSTIERRDADIGAYLSIDPEGALEAAKLSDNERQGGISRKLQGVPIGVKDILNVAGQSCTCGSKILEGYVSPYDASVIGRLRDQGAIFLGRLNMDEFAMGSSTENSAFKTTRNPHQLECVPGGSSGGSAAAVAGCEAVVALGTDTGGSIRQPASFCGCVGMKPSYGRVSRYGLTAFASSLDQVGPISKDVRDAALLTGIIAGRDEMDSTTLDAPVPDYESALGKDLKGITLGLPREYFGAGIDSQVEERVHAAVDLCRGLGAEIIDVSLPHTEYAVASYYVLATAEASTNLARFDGVRYGFRAAEGSDPFEMYCKTRAEGFGVEVKRRIILGTYVLSGGYYDTYYLTAQKVRTLIRSDFDKAFEQCYAILAPVAPTAAYKVGEKVDDPLRMYLDDCLTVPANLTGMCGMSVPCGKTAEGLPVGLQVLGPRLKEERVFHVAHAYESARESS